MLQLLTDHPFDQMSLLQRPSLPGNEFFDDPPPGRDMFTSGQFGHHMFQRLDSFPPNIRDFCDIPSGNLQISGSAGPVIASEQIMGYAREVGMLSSSPGPLLWDQSNLSIQTSSGEMVSSHDGSCAARIPTVGAPITSSKWIKLIAALKWLAISRRSAARRAKTLDINYRAATLGRWIDASGRGW